MFRCTRRSRRHSHPLAAVLALVAALAGARVAHAQQVCGDANTLPNPVYLAIGDTQVNLIKAIGKQLRDTENVTLIWQATGSCTNLGNIYAKTPLSGTFSYIPANYDAVGMPTPPTCTVPMPGVQIDLANSIVFLEGCPAMKPAAVTDTLGPVQSFVFAVPTASTQATITAAEAYFVFGFGKAGMVAPWVDESQMFVRPTTKGTIISMGASIHVPAGKWKGVQVALSPDVANMTAMSGSPQAAIGILGSEVYDGYRNVLKSLAFRAYTQQLAYFPDATSAGFDRQNVRDGHYHMWSYTHWLFWTDGNGTPLNPTAKRVADIIAGNAVNQAPKFEVIDTVHKVGLVPACAMKVKRTSEGGDFTWSAPAQPCGCYFDSIVGKTSCSTCKVDGDCTGGACRHGYCEAQ